MIFKAMYKPNGVESVEADSIDKVTGLLTDGREPFMIVATQHVEFGECYQAIVINGEVQLNYKGKGETTDNENVVSFVEVETIKEAFGKTVARPIITPASGKVDKYTQVTITCSTEGSTIYYTIDGTEPSKDNGLIYNQPIEVLDNMVVKAIAYNVDDEGNEIKSSVVTSTYEVALQTVARPNVSASGTVQVGTKVTLTCSTEGATIYYTLDGSTPTTDSQVYSDGEEISVTDGMVLKAFAVKVDYLDSSVLSVKYTVTMPTVEKPSVSKSGNVSLGTVVTLSCGTVDAEIYYTIDGSTPSKDNGTLYDGNGISVTDGMTLKAIAVKENYKDSPILTATYTIVLPTVATPKASPSGSSIQFGTPVTLSCDTADADIYYTIDGSIPSKTNGMKYSGEEITVTNGMTLKSIGIKENYKDSSIFSVTYTVTKQTVAKPTVSPTSTTVNPGSTVTLACSTTDAEIYYTVDGSTPSKTNGTKYNGEQIPVTNQMTLKAIGVKENFNDSQILSVKYTVNLPKVSTPVITPSSGEVTSGTMVKITCGTSGARIYYTIDGSTPTASSLEYTGEIQITNAVTVKAIGILDGYTDSSVASASYTIKAPEPVEAMWFGGLWLGQNPANEDDVDYWISPDGTILSTGDQVFTEEFVQNLSTKLIDYQEYPCTDELPSSKYTLHHNETTDYYGTQQLFIYPSSYGVPTSFEDGLGVHDLDNAYTVIENAFVLNGVTYNVVYQTTATFLGEGKTMNMKFIA